GRVIIEFIKAALQNKHFPIFGDGKQTRSFCYVSDLIDGITAAMEKGGKEEIYNLGNPNEFTVLELVEIVKKLTDSTSKLTFTDLPEDDPQKRCPDISKAKQELGWKPKIELEEGLKKLIDYLQK
ncbi:MAG: GDP-mannose 4,6-dehydratase, partial [Patescibacteria group bacterium]